MFIPRYWKKVIFTVDTKGFPPTYHGHYPFPESLEIIAWGYSDKSLYEAEQRAEIRKSEILEAMRNPETENFYYPSNVTREEILQRVGSEQEEEAIITRNRYYSQVMNTARMMFVDIDLDFSDIRNPSWLHYLFGRSEQAKEELAAKRKLRAEEAVERLKDFVLNDHDIGMRVYQTYAGLRVIVTSKPYEPDSEEAHQIMDALNADPLYYRLCKSQNCFRARLTPKYWRMNGDILKKLRPSPASKIRTVRDMLPVWNSRDEERLRQYDQWVREYEKLHRTHATCRFMEQIGSNTIVAKFERLINLHDDITCAYKQLSLA